MTRYSAGLQRTVALLGLAAYSRQAFDAAHQAERILAHGRIVGLSEDETREVVRAWSDWYRCSPWPMAAL